LEGVNSGLMLNLNQLRAFYEVAKTQNVRQASKRLFVSQPAVSNQIKMFEESCGLNLFKRQGRRIIITDIGRIFLNRCHALFDLEKVIENDIQEFHNLQIGVLKVGTVKAFAQYILGRYVNRFHSLYPGIKFSLDEGNSHEIGMSLLRFENEIAIIGKIPGLNGVEFLPFFTERVLLFARQDHPLVKKKQGIRFDELKGHPIIIKHTGSGTRHVVDAVFFRHAFPPHIMLETSNVGFLRQIIEQGECAAFLAETEFNKEFNTEDCRMIPIIDEEINLEVNIAYLEGQLLSPAAKAFLELVTRDSGKMNFSQRQ